MTEKSLRTIFTLYLPYVILSPEIETLGTLSNEISSTLVAGLV